MPSQKFADQSKVTLLRKDLGKRRNHRFVGRSEFQRLLVSFKRLERFVDCRARIRGLHDPAKGINYLIEEENLFRTESA